MKKLLILSLMLGTIAIAAPVAEAKTNGSSITTAAPQLWEGQPRRNRRWNRRSVIRTRIVRAGFRTYRETYRITYLPNGRTRVNVISRVRIR